MIPYGNKSGDAGVTAYEERASGIVLEFADGSRYLYDHVTPGRRHVAAMKRLAAAGEGLTTYVNQHVGAAYALKLR